MNDPSLFIALIVGKLHCMMVGGGAGRCLLDATVDRTSQLFATQVTALLRLDVIYIVQRISVQTNGEEMTATTARYIQISNAQMNAVELNILVQGGCTWLRHRFVGVLVIGMRMRLTYVVTPFQLKCRLIQSCSWFIIEEF